MEKERLERLLYKALCWIEEENSDYFANEVDDEYQWFEDAIDITEAEMREIGIDWLNKRGEYQIIQTKENFEDIPEEEQEVYDERYTNDIEDAMNDFCEEMGESYMYDIDTMTCSDDWGNEYKFVKKGE